MHDEDDARFAWHPRYRDRTLREVRAEITQELASDQRAFALALEGAEQHEGQVLASVVPLEKRWGEFDWEWATTDATALGGRIAAFERERDRRRELFPYAEYRITAYPTTAPDDAPSDAPSGDPWWAFWRR